MIQKFWKEPQENCFSSDSSPQPGSHDPMTCTRFLRFKPHIHTILNRKTVKITYHCAFRLFFIKLASVCIDLEESGNEYVAEKNLIQRTRKVKERGGTVKSQGQ